MYVGDLISLPYRFIFHILLPHQLHQYLSNFIYILNVSKFKNRISVLGKNMNVQIKNYFNLNAEEIFFFPIKYRLAICLSPTVNQQTRTVLSVNEP